MTRAGGKVHWARDAEEANRIIAGIAKEHGAGGGRQGQVHSHGRDQAQRAPGARGHQGLRDGPRGAHHPARRGDLIAHPRAGDPQEPRGDQGAVPEEARRARPLRRALRPGRGGPPVPAREVPEGEGRHHAGLTSRSPRPVRSASSSPRATAACVRRLPPVLVTLMGIEKVIPAWRDFEVYMQLLPAPRRPSG